MKNIKQYLIESKRVIYNDEGKKVPAICPECGGKVVLVLEENQFIYVLNVKNILVLCHLKNDKIKRLYNRKW